MREHTVDQALIKIDHLRSGSQLPLVIESVDEGLSLVEWASGGHEWIESQLYQHGGLLFRGFDVPSESDFEKFATIICPEPVVCANFYRPGDNVGNARTAVKYPATKKILWHNEDNINHSRWPSHIMFHCSKPAVDGGETPIVDCRRVFDRIDPKLKERFIDKGIMYVDNFWPSNNAWQTCFRSTNPSEVENFCRKTFMEFEWLEGDRLRTRYVRPAIFRHPITGEKLWFNFLHLNYMSGQGVGERQSLLSRFKLEDLPSHCYYGDGSEIEDSVVTEICEIYGEEEVVFSWQENDVLVLDNMLIAHGRNPFVGVREHFVAISSKQVNCFDLLAEGQKPNPELIRFLQNRGVPDLQALVQPERS